MGEVKVILFANTDWYLYNFRIGLARALRRRGVEVHLLSPPGPYVQSLEREGFTWHPVFINRRAVSPIAEATSIRDVYRIYRAVRPQLVHHFTIKCVVQGSIAARLAGVDRRVNAVAGMGHVFSNSGMRARALRPLVRVALRGGLAGPRARLIVQNSEDLRVFRDSQLVHPQRIHLIRGSGVNTSIFKPGERSGDAPPVVRILMASRLLWDKGVREYVDAALSLSKRRRHIEFLLAGTPDEGNPGSVPIGVLDEWRKLGAVKLLGHVDDMPSLLSQVHIMVLPTSYGEGVPRSLVEAAACGLPIIASDSAGCREVVAHGENGLMVPPRDAQALASAIENLIDHPEERRRMGIRGRERVLNEFEESIVLEKTLAVYDELLMSPA